jgi:hypothetical protein
MSTATPQDIKDLYGDLLWIASVLEESNPVRSNQVRDLARQAQEKERELELARAENVRLRQGIEATMLFHSMSPWDTSKASRWTQLTGKDTASNRVLCDFLRTVQAAAMNCPEMVP